jgi:hypothetical protein
VSVYQAVESIAGHLSADASLGLGPDWAARSAALRDAAGKADLNGLAKEFYDPGPAVLVVVGPKAKLVPMLAPLGLPPPEVRDEEGRPLP